MTAEPIPPPEATPKLVRGFASGLPDSEPKQKPRKPSARTQKKSSAQNPKPYPPPEYDLGDFPNVKWEPNRKSGGSEAWHNPDGARNRSHRTYLGYLNPAQVAELRSLEPGARRQAIAEWIAERRAKKGIG